MIEICTSLHLSCLPQLLHAWRLLCLLEVYVSNHLPPFLPRFPDQKSNYNFESIIPMPVRFSDADYLIRCAIKTLIVIFQFHEISSPHVMNPIRKERDVIWRRKQQRESFLCYKCFLTVCWPKVLKLTDLKASLVVVSGMEADKNFETAGLQRAVWKIYWESVLCFYFLIKKKWGMAVQLQESSHAFGSGSQCPGPELWRHSLVFMSTRRKGFGICHCWGTLSLSPVCFTVWLRGLWWWGGTVSAASGRSVVFGKLGWRGPWGGWNLLGEEWNSIFCGVLGFRVDSFQLCFPKPRM